MGWEEWHGTYNKVFLVHKLMQENQYDMVLSLDADAMVNDADWDVEQVVVDLGSPLVAAQLAGGKFAWDLNAGVKLWNMKSPYAREVISKLFKRGTEMIGVLGDDEMSRFHVLSAVVCQ